MLSTASATAPGTRHSLLVRSTHWVNVVCFLAQITSGIAILLAYPRLHWGETGSLGMPAFIELPLPTLIYWDWRGPGRSLHFFTAWIFLINGLAYLVAGFWTRHFRREVLPLRSEISAAAMVDAIRTHGRQGRGVEEHFLRYNVLQKMAYSTVVFVLLPFMLFSGLAMSPAVTSVWPFLVVVLGGHQSARTLHFFVACLLVLFVLGHVLLTLASGFVRRMRAMTIG